MHCTYNWLCVWSHADMCYMCMNVCTCTCVLVWTYVCMCTCMYVVVGERCAYMCMCECADRCACVWVHIYACMRPCRDCVCTSYVHVHSHICQSHEATQSSRCGAWSQGVYRPEFEFRLFPCLPSALVWSSSLWPFLYSGEDAVGVCVGPPSHTSSRPLGPPQAECGNSCTGPHLFSTMMYCKCVLVSRATTWKGTDCVA